MAKVTFWVPSREPPTEMLQQQLFSIFGPPRGDTQFGAEGAVEITKTRTKTHAWRMCFDVNVEVQKDARNAPNNHTNTLYS